MWNPFRRKHNKQAKTLQQISYTFAIINEFNRRGLLHWQVKDKALLIEESLATVEMARGREDFTRFLDQVAQWQNFQLLQEAYDRQRIEAEAAAVKAAQTPGRVLTNADIQRIRQHARDTMIEIDPASLGMINEFDLFIIRANAPSAAEATESAGQLVAVGHYDGQKLEMAAYDDIKDAMYGDKDSEE
jgi:hypothetical protein